MLRIFGNTNLSGKPMIEMLTYARFSSLEDSEQLIGLLVKNHILYELTHEINQLDAVYIGQALDQFFVLKIPKDEFLTLNGILAAEAKNDFKSPGFTHYFDSFDDNELEDVLNHPNDWNAYDEEIARLLIEKNKNIYPRASSSIDYLSSYKPDKIPLPWLLVWYLLCFSFLGVISGYFIRYSKKTLGNGKSVFIYDETSRMNGLIFLIVGTIGSTVYFLKMLFRY